jgi:hypothetical protein
MRIARPRDHERARGIAAATLGRMTRFRSAFAAIAIGAAAAAPTAAEPASDPVAIDYTPPPRGPVEEAVVPATLGGWDVVVLPKDAVVFRGLATACADVADDLDVADREAQRTEWFTDSDVANAAAIRATARAEAARGAAPGRVERYDADDAAVVRYRARRELALFSLIDAHNAQALLDRIDRDLDAALATPIGGWVAQRAWAGGGDARDDDDDRDAPPAIGATIDREQLARSLAEPRALEAVDAYVREHAGALALDTGARARLRDDLRADGWDDGAAGAELARRDAVAARAVVETIARLGRWRFAIRFATGYGMTWDEQKAALGTAAVAARRLASVATFASADSVPQPYVFALAPFAHGRVVATIGHRAQDLDRISTAEEDRALLEAIRAYVNVDGIWAPEVPSLWHRANRATGEIAVFAPRGLVTPAGCVAPGNFAARPPARDLRDDDLDPPTEELHAP